MPDFNLPEPPQRDLTDHELDALLTRSQDSARTAVAGAFDLEAGLLRATRQTIDTWPDRQNLYVTSGSVIAAHSAGTATIPNLGPVGTLATAVQTSENPSSTPFARRRTGSTALRILVGAELRRLRVAKGITRNAAGAAIRASHSKISRLEAGRTGFKARDVTDLLTLYGVIDGIERASLLRLVQQANALGWWRTYADVVPIWFEHFLGLEQAAAIIRSYEVQFVPGLLQTSEYARAMVTLGDPEATEVQIERRLDLWAKRQEILHRSDPPKVWAIIDEAALRRPIGSTTTMRAQLEYLIEIAGLPHVAVQVLPLRVGGRVAAGGPITILRFTEQMLPDVVYLEHLTSAAYLEEPSDVDHYQKVMMQLGVAAEQPSASARALRKILCDL